MIYIITHKIFKPYFEDKRNYQVLHVGKNNNAEKSYLRDDVGENISEKNKNFCELTGLYWIWKNSKEEANEIVGLVHYRRYFTTRLKDILYTYFGWKPQVIGYSKIEKYLKKVDIILPISEHIVRTVYQSYVDVHNSEDLKLTRKAIERYSPEYVKTFDKVMNSHHYYYANMMICKKKIIDRYCEWLFGVFDVLEPMIDIDKYEDEYQKRVFGFLSERLLQVWVEHNKLKIKEIAVFNTEERRITIFEKNKSRMQKIFRKFNGK